LSSKKKESKAKPKKSVEKAPPRAEAEAPKTLEAPKPRGAIPVALVSSRHLGDLIEREARGFSLGELGSAGLTLSSASSLGLMSDIRRRTVLEKNVESLKSWFTPPPKAAAKPKPAVLETKVEEPKPKKRAP